MGLLSISFCQESTWEKSSTSMVWNSLSHKMTFREPIVFTPFEVKAGYLNYGGKDYWSGSIFNKTPITTSDLPVFLDSTQYQFNILDALSNMAFGALLFSEFVPLQHMGGLMVFAMFSTSFGTLTILASLLELTGRRKKVMKKLLGEQ